MKKNIIIALCAAMLLSGCSSKAESSSQSSQEETSATSQTSQETSVADVDLEALGETATTSGGEWPSMYIPNDDEFSDYFGVSKTDEMFSQVYGSFCPMSAILTEVLLVVPASGSEQQVQEFLDGRKELLIEKYAYYPSDKELAENAIIGNTNGIYYLLCAEKAQDAEQAIIAELS